MKKLLGLIFGAGAAGYATMIIIGIAVTTIGGLGFSGYTMYQNWITGIQNEATAKCVQAIDTAEHEKLKADMTQALADLAEERRRSTALAQENGIIKATSASHHNDISAGMKTVKCTIPDKVVDTVNAPLKSINSSLNKGIK